MRWKITFGFGLMSKTWKHFLVIVFKVIGSLFYQIQMFKVGKYDHMIKGISTLEL